MKVFIKIRNEQALPNVLAMHQLTLPIQVADSSVVIADLSEEQIARAIDNPALEVYKDFQLRAFDSENWWERETNRIAPALAPSWMSKTMDDVMRHNRAAEAWSVTRGKGVTIAVVDTGTDLSTGQFPNRSMLDYAPSFANATEDIVGHGSMCAAIACGANGAGGRFNGVAPAATLLTARSSLQMTDLYLIYEHLLREKQKGSFAGGLVVSNSYGFYTCKAPLFPDGHPYLDLLRLCIAAGIVFVFAAGNNHADGLCKFAADADQPNTIWTVNSIDEVICVGTVDADETNQKQGTEHANSSRGPGQWAVSTQKPDVVAPTYGEVVWAGGYRHMEWWGTSGACPQVAGLAALLLSQNPALTPREIQEIIRKSARSLPGPANCVGSGMIDCVEALKLL